MPRKPFALLRNESNCEHITTVPMTGRPVYMKNSSLPFWKRSICQDFVIFFQDDLTQIQEARELKILPALLQFISPNVQVEVSS